MPLDYVVKRFGMFLPDRLAGRDGQLLPAPARRRRPSPADSWSQQAAMGGSIQTGLEDMIADLRREIRPRTAALEAISDLPGRYAPARLQLLDRPTIPRPSSYIIGRALPWTLGLLMTTTSSPGSSGALLGAFMGWPRSPKFLSFLMPPLLSLNAIPFFLLGLVLVYFFAFRLRLFPLSGGYTPGTFPAVDSVVRRETSSTTRSCPPSRSSSSRSAAGPSAMRAMMVTTHGEDYVTYADAKGLKDRTIFLRYAIRNALLPQTTALALVLGQLISGAVLVEVVFSYPGIGNVLFHAIRGSDFYLVQGIVFILILSIGLDHPDSRSHLSAARSADHLHGGRQVSSARRRSSTSSRSNARRECAPGESAPPRCLGYCGAIRRCSSGWLPALALLLFVVIGHLTVDLDSSPARFRSAACSRPRGSFPSAATSRAATSTR